MLKILVKRAELNDDSFELGVGHCGFQKNSLISLINNCKQRFTQGNFPPFTFVKAFNTKGNRSVSTELKAI